MPLNKHNAMFWACHILLWLNFVFYFVTFFLGLFPCMPIKKNWNPWIKGRCMNVLMIYVVESVINAVSDVSILILPQFVIWNLQISLKRKIGIFGMFLPGVL